MWTRVFLFVLAVGGGGLGAVAGSVIGSAFGRTGLFAGGVIGGLLAPWIVARIAIWLKWVPPTRLASVAIGMSLGFLAAAAIAVSTLSSPVGPVLSTLLIGAGAVIGTRSGPKN